MNHESNTFVSGLSEYKTSIKEMRMGLLKPTIPRIFADT
jgi:hypothetical protein